MSMFDDVKEFHEKFQLAYSGPPRRLPRDLWQFRVRFLREEWREFTEASYGLSLDEPDRDAKIMARELDALVDLVYVAMGTAALQGLNFNEAWRRVHEANMKKKRGKSSDSARSYEDPEAIVKPPGWVAPDLSDLVRPVIRTPDTDGWIKALEDRGII